MKKHAMSLEEKLNFIADKLWSGHAALMVGAGFSKNVSEKFADWRTLSDKMYETVYNKKPGDDARYISTLKIAYEYELSQGKNALNNLLKKEIPDTDFDPSDLHKKILELPWVDVFTTNYDRLLERAAEDIYKIRYETIERTNELINSTKPRIIKLHGSFPDITPFIITEKDYRTYPMKFAPFVNTVQQSLIENVLCLVGFSGDDPNFIQWLGWISDNLGENNETKIYLIGALELTETKKEILTKKGIETIDFVDVFGERDDKHEKAISAFIDHLSSQNTLKDKLNWGIPANTKHGFRKNGNPLKQIHELYNLLKEKHDTYPNWVICPKENRKGVQYYFKQQFLLDNWFLEKAKELDFELDIHFLYEFNWLREIALFDLNSDIIEYIIVVLNKYDPFNIEQSEAKKTPKNDPDLNWDNIEKYWIELYIALLKFYRKYGFHEEWLEINSVIEKVQHEICPENFHAYQFEKCLCQLYRFNFDSLLNCLADWEITDNFTFWKTKKAGLFIEIGKYDKAQDLLNQALKLVRNQLRLKPIKDDFRLPSEESYIMLLVLVIENIKLERVNFKDFKDRTKEINERWRSLEFFKCNPVKELDEIYSYFKFLPPPHQTYYRTESFNLEQDIITHIFTSDENMEKCFELLNLVDNIALPFGYSNLSEHPKAISHMISYISRNSTLLDLAANLIIRKGLLLDIEKMFGYHQIFRLSLQESDEIVLKYFDIIRNWRSSKEDFIPESKRTDTFQAIKKVVPELLSRLCLRCSLSIKIEIIDFIKEVSENDNLIEYRDSKFDKLVDSLIHSLSKREIRSLIPKFISFPLLDDEYIAFDPFTYFDSNLNFDCNISIENSIIDNLLVELIESSQKKRAVAAQRLNFLYDNGFLTNSQSEKFGEGLWTYLDQNNFPKDTGLYQCVFLRVPHPKNIDPQAVFKKYILSIDNLPPKRNKNGFIGSGDSLVYENIIKAAKYTKIDWSKECLEHILILILESWEKEKKYLFDKSETRNPNNALYINELQVKLFRIVEIELILFSNNIERFSDENKRILIELIKEKIKLGIKPLSLSTAFQFYLDQNINNEVIEMYLYSPDKNTLEDALKAAKIMVEKESEKCKGAISVICDMLKFKDENLLSYLRFTNFILIEHSNLLQNHHLQAIDLALKRLNLTIKTNKYNSNQDININIELSKFTFNLKNYYSQIQREVPHSIIAWENVFKDENQLSGYRRIWDV